ncbi:MAG: helix-turn-helix domain-containing protein [Polyangiaceae bacterium]|nr:helix-turn-helix domain-containing protein [Polyangiaceae bacterium]
MAIQRDMKLLTASEVAELCEVDLKTIHNWVERGCIPHFRTPGRHLRFRVADVASFLRDWGYAIPRRFYAEIAQAVLVVGSRDALTVVTRAAGQSATIHSVGDLYEGLVRLGAEPTTAIVFETAMVKRHADIIEQVVSAVKRAYPVQVLVLGDDDIGLADRAEVTFVPMGDSKMLRAALTGDVQDPADIEEGLLPRPPSRRRFGPRGKRAGTA